ncbi:hypothetical protein PanWU01x14_339240, partial [Parasponia andersonii]
PSVGSVATRVYLVSWWWWSSSSSLLLSSLLSIFHTRILWSWCALKSLSPETTSHLTAPFPAKMTLLLLLLLLLLLAFQEPISRSEEPVKTSFPERVMEDK